MIATDDLLIGFVEDSKEHLGDIEESLLDIERTKDDFDEELVNSVFRAAHSIKGGAGMLGLEGIKELSHKLENVLHMVRTRELVPDKKAVSILLKGFDRLNELLSDIETSNEADVSREVAQLKELAETGMSSEEAEASKEDVEIVVNDHIRFSVDPVSLKQAVKAGESIYCCEFDLIHDIHRKNRTPLDIIKIMLGVGRILDSRLDIAAVGTLDGDYQNRIPLYILFSTQAMQGALGSLLDVDDDRIRALEDMEGTKASAAPAQPEKAAQEASKEQSPPAEEALPRDGVDGNYVFGTSLLALEAEPAMLKLGPEMTGEDLAEAKKAFLAALEIGKDLAMDWSGVESASVGFLQLVASAFKTYELEGRTLSAASDPPEAVLEAAQIFGFTAESLIQCAEESA